MTKNQQRKQDGIDAAYEVSQAQVRAFHHISAAIQGDFNRDFNGLVPASLSTVMTCLEMNAEIAVNLRRASEKLMGTL